MAQLKISHATKETLLLAVKNCRAFNPWLFPFVVHDSEFLKELIKTAEDANNIKFIESYKQYCFQTSKIASPVFSDQSQKRKKPKRTLLKNKTKILNHSLAPRYQLKNDQTQGGVKRDPCFESNPKQSYLDPKTLPRELVKVVRKSDYAYCELCQAHVLKTVMKEHQEMACPHRGVAKGQVSQKVNIPNNSIVFCECGAVAIPGDTCCYDHKHN